MSNRIRQINEHIHHIRDAYGSVQFEDDPVLSPLSAHHSQSQAATNSDPLQPQPQQQQQSHSQNCTNFPTDNSTASSNNHSLESNSNTFDGMYFFSVEFFENFKFCSIFYVAKQLTNIV